MDWFNEVALELYKSSCEYIGGNLIGQVDN